MNFDDRLIDKVEQLDKSEWLLVTDMGASWTQSWKEEFKVHKLRLLTSKPELLLQPRWDIPPLLWLLYRCFMLLYTFSWFIYTALLFNTPKFLIFLSHISYCLMVIYYLVSLCNLAWAFLEIRCSSHRMKRGVSSECETLLSLPVPLTAALCLQWLLHSLMGCFSLTVSFLYWTIIHPFDQHSFTAFNINIHVINSIQTAVDLLLSSTPVHLTHFFYAVLGGALYVMFAVVYWLMAGTNMFGQPYIYSILDFSGHPLVATLCILGVCLLCLPSCHFVLWNLQLLRERMVSREKARRIALRREVWWCVKVSGGTTFDLVPSLDPAASVFETSRRTAMMEDQQSQSLTLV
ncbi:protein rolling stone-like [Sinocyclocheilus rhinocerous]|uniref:protein rolling stone-like n=1 Tax=Sinocyclocheilus rhinocerous TaxID=307959 RepID=UPI0007B88BC8|nr:PREDICTED: protein rolling stone-like [Sinocyclocheilus rhinocerous]